MKKLIIILVSIVCSLQMYGQEKNTTNFEDGCNTIVDFESNQLGSTANWLGHNASTPTVVSNNSNMISIEDDQHASFIYNTSNFPKNLIAAGCTFKYDVIYRSGGGVNASASNNSLEIFKGTNPHVGFYTSKARFVLHPNHLINTGGTTNSIEIPLELATNNSLPSNSYGYWTLVGSTAPYSVLEINSFNTLLQDNDGIGFFLDEGANPMERWWYDNFCIRPCTIFDPSFICCESKLDIFNTPGTPNPLNTEQRTENGTTMTIASEEFQINRDATIPITELRVVVTDIVYKYNYESCGECINNPALLGSFYSTSTIGEKGLFKTSPDYGLTNPNFVDQNANVREMIWKNPQGALLRKGDKFTVNYILPAGSDIPCCVTEVKICTKISWKDANCCENEILTCSNIKLENVTAGDGNTSNCECGKQIGTGITVNPRTTGLSGSLNNPLDGQKCGSTVRVDLYKNHWFSKEIHEFRAPAYICKSNDCNLSYKWEIMNADGSVHKTGMGPTIRTSFPSRGTFKVRFTPICGGKECAPCDITVNVR